MPSHSPSTQHAPPRHSRKRTNAVLDSDDEENHVASDQPHRSLSTHSRSSSRSSSPELREDLPRSELYQAARTQQKKANDAKRQLRATERQLADITNQDDEPPKRGRPKKRKVLNGGSEEDTAKIQLLGHKFTIMGMLWLHDLNRTFNTAVDDQYNPLERFQNRASKVQGELADLLELLPAKFHGETCSEWLIKTFGDAMQSQRSNTSTRLRGASGPSILSCTDDDMSTSESRRDKFRDMIGYTTTPKGSTYETYNVEVLHKDYKGSFDRDTVFRGEKLHLTFAAVTLGPKAVTALKKTGKPTPASGKTMSHLWNLDHSTVGSVAAIGILTRWVASADLHLTAKGAQTGINWKADLEDYIEYLQTGLDQRKASVLRIFREWDELFFPDSETGLAGDGANDEDHEKEKQSAMDLLRDDEEE